jgi:hypothetical protein
MFKPRLYRARKEVGRRSEDAFACNRTVGRFVLSDGASTSYAGRAWARALCWQFMCDPNFGADWLQAARMRFSDTVSVPDDDWSAVMASERGSFATFLGFTVLPNGIQGYAVGDSVLFIIDRQDCVHWIPCLCPGDFAKDPILLSTHRGLGMFAETEGDFDESRIDFAVESGTISQVRALAMTDAVAAWAIGTGEKTEILDRLTTLIQLTSNSQFGDFVRTERAAGSLKTDDCTVMILEP